MSSYIRIYNLRFIFVRRMPVRQLVNRWCHPDCWPSVSHYLDISFNTTENQRLPRYQLHWKPVEVRCVNGNRDVHVVGCKQLSDLINTPLVPILVQISSLFYHYSSILYKLHDAYSYKVLLYSFLFGEHLPQLDARILSSIKYPP